jgi:prolipoprotein diacylglyceryltransferase
VRSMIHLPGWEAKGGERDLVYEVALWGFPAGVIGGRLYFLATSWRHLALPSRGSTEQWISSRRWAAAMRP